MHKFNDKNLATYRYKQKQNSGPHSAQALGFKVTCFAVTLCILSSPLFYPFAKHTSSFPGYGIKLCAKFSKSKFRTEMKKHVFPKHATSSELNWASD